jgi:hypothetical protein
MTLQFSCAEAGKLMSIKINIGRETNLNRFTGVAIFINLF